MLAASLTQCHGHLNEASKVVVSKVSKVHAVKKAFVNTNLVLINVQIEDWLFM